MHNNDFNSKEIKLTPLVSKEQLKKDDFNKDKPKKKINFSFILLVIYFLFAIGNIIYQRYTAAKLIKRADAVIQAQKMRDVAYAEQQKQIAAEGAAQKRLIPQAEDGFYVEPPVEEQKRVSSTELLMKAVEAEKGAMQTEEQKQQALDYGAQVAAYEAQVKAQQQAAQQKVQQPTLNRASQPQPTQRANTQQAAATQTQQEGGTKLNKLETRRIFK